MARGPEDGDAARAASAPAMIALGKALLVGLAGLSGAAIMLWLRSQFGTESFAFAFAVVWFPMATLAAFWNLFHPRLPEGFHALRPFERDGRAYERLGVKLAKRLLRRGPLSVFSPGLRRRGERTPAELARLERGMREAEAVHAIMFTLTAALALASAGFGAWRLAAWLVALDVAVNGYPTLVQRYNRAWLARQYGPPRG